MGGSFPDATRLDPTRNREKSVRRDVDGANLNGRTRVESDLGPPSSSCALRHGFVLELVSSGGLASSWDRMRVMSWLRPGNRPNPGLASSWKTIADGLASSWICPGNDSLRLSDVQSRDLIQILDLIYDDFRGRPIPHWLRLFAPTPVIRGPSRQGCRVIQRSMVVRRTPLPDPLPQGEREPEKTPSPLVGEGRGEGTSDGRNRPLNDPGRGWRLLDGGMGGPKLTGWIGSTILESIWTAAAPLPSRDLTR